MEKNNVRIWGNNPDCWLFYEFEFFNSTWVDCFNTWHNIHNIGKIK